MGRRERWRCRHRGRSRPRRRPPAPRDRRIRRPGRMWCPIGSSPRSTFRGRTTWARRWTPALAWPAAGCVSCRCGPLIRAGGRCRCSSSTRPGRGRCRGRGRSFVGLPVRAPGRGPRRSVADSPVALTDELERLPPWALYGGAGVLAGGGYLLYRRRKATAATGPPAGSSGATSTMAYGASDQPSSIVPYYLTANPDQTTQGTAPPPVLGASVPGGSSATGSPIGGGVLPPIPPILPISPEPAPPPPPPPPPAP